MKHTSQTRFHLLRRACFSSVLLGSSFGVAAGQSCPDGQLQQQVLTQGCYPADCSSLQALDWGSGGVPTQGLTVNKFDASLGTLLEVELEYKARFVGSGCIDNLTASCVAVQLSAALLSIAAPSAINSPQVTGLGPVQLAASREITPLGFNLGASDGFNDCQTPGVTFGLPSLGNCVPGEDHFAYTFDESYVQPLGSLSGNDLAAWIGAPGQAVAFDTTALGLYTGSGGGSGAQSQHLFSARVWLEVKYTYCPAPQSVGSAYCFCTSTSPCGNVGGVGEGCANGTGAGASLSATGSASILAANLVLHGSQLPPNQPGLFFQAQNATAGGQGALFGDGLRCADGSVMRLQVRAADAQGDMATNIDIASKGAVVSGALLRYQLWYRDPWSSPCGGLFNLSHGLELTWVP